MFQVFFSHCTVSGVESSTSRPSRQSHSPNLPHAVCEFESGSPRGLKELLNVLKFTGTRKEVVRRGGRYAVPVRATRGPHRADRGRPQGACWQQYHPHQQGDQAEDQRDRDRVAGPGLQVASHRKEKGGRNNKCRLDIVVEKKLLLVAATTPRKIDFGWLLWGKPRDRGKISPHGTNPGRKYSSSPLDYLPRLAHLNLKVELKQTEDAEDAERAKRRR